MFKTKLAMIEDITLVCSIHVLIVCVDGCIVGLVYMRADLKNHMRYVILIQSKVSLFTIREV